MKQKRRNRQLETYFCKAFVVLGPFLVGACETDGTPPLNTSVTAPMLPARPSADGTCATIADCAQAAVQAARSASDAAARAYLPVGTIIAWWPPDPHTQVPDGWAICDGKNGRPNLVNKFLSGVGNAADVSDGSQTVAGHFGEATHTHHFSGTTHRPSGAQNATQPNGYLTSMGTDHTHDFDGDTLPAYNIPPNIHVLFIIKLR
jgi:hypothetical protein